jgi:phosphatidate cytidylyltransferase
MIQTRLLIGSLLALAAGGLLIGDSWLAANGYPWYPFLFAFMMFGGVLCARELLRLLPPIFRPSQALTVGGVLLLLAANWYPALHFHFTSVAISPWPVLLGVLVGVLLTGFLLEMRRYNGEPGAAVPRLALTLFVVAYIGLLPAFFIQMRWLPVPPAVSGLMLALVVFVPKGNDVGAFFTGTFLGRHKMTPLLSPKKTWQGFSGGMLAGVGAALVGLLLERFAGQAFRHGVVEAVAFGLVIGLAGVLGDLAESLIKRDCHTKDASHSIPGFGGMLDVVDSVLFAAPVAYLWFSVTS